MAFDLPALQQPRLIGGLLQRFEHPRRSCSRILSSRPDLNGNLFHSKPQHCDRFVSLERQRFVWLGFLIKIVFNDNRDIIYRYASVIDRRFRVKSKLTRKLVDSGVQSLDSSLKRSFLQELFWKQRFQTRDLIIRIQNATVQTGRVPLLISQPCWTTIQQTRISDWKCRYD